MLSVQQKSGLERNLPERTEESSPMSDSSVMPLRVPGMDPKSLDLSVLEKVASGAFVASLSKEF